MHAPNALSWVGRRQRRDCAITVSGKLVVMLQEAGARDECELLVNPLQLAAFRSRPLSQPVEAQLRQLRFRISRELNKELADATSVALTPFIEDGRVRWLVVKAIRSRNPIA